MSIEYELFGEVIPEDTVIIPPEKVQAWKESHKMTSPKDLDLHSDAQVAVDARIGPVPLEVELAQQIIGSVLTNLSNRPLVWWQRMAFEANRSANTPAAKLNARTLFLVVQMVQELEKARVEELEGLTLAQTKRPFGTPDIKIEG